MVCRPAARLEARDENELKRKTRVDRPSNEMTRPPAVLLSLAFLSASLPLFAGQVREYAIILQDAPVAARITSRKELRSSAALQADRQIEAAQQALRRTLAGRGGVKVIGSVHTLLNAVFVRVPEEDAAGLASLPGVRRVVEMRPVKLELDKALPLVHVPQAWQTVGASNAGAGIKIGVIDTGIDQTHPGLKDDSLAVPSGYPICIGSDCDFTSNKVIVARSYVEMVAAGYTSDPSQTSAPDDLSPRDRVGHGTAAAMVAAGVQTTGPLATISGVAPKAFLGNYKIFGSPGVNDSSTESAMVKALDDAFNDHMDIVTMSLGLAPAWDYEDMGAACGETDPKAPCDIGAQAVMRATALGMAVAVAAGNDGEAGILYSLNGTSTLNTIHTPGIAPDAITVGATRNGHLFYSSVALTGAGVPSNLAAIKAIFGDGPAKAASGTLRDAGLACGPIASGSFSGSIALIQRGQCVFAAKVNNVQLAGAVGAIIFDDQTEPLFSPGDLAGTAIPAALISNADGTAVQSYLDSHPGVQATLDPAPKAFDDPNVNQPAAFSSRGPAFGAGILKPELVGPGTDMYMATQRFDPNGDMYDPSGYTIASGTSFSAPMVAGALAVVKQQHPNWSVGQLKSAVVNTADSLGANPVTSVGAGLLNVDAAARTNVTVEPSAVSFGAITAGSLPTVKALTVTNMSGATLTLSVQPIVADTSAHITLLDSTVAPGQTKNIGVKLDGTLPSPGAYQGVIAITGGAVNLRVPYLYLVGDGVPHDAAAVWPGFIDKPGASNWVLVRTVDQYGVPVVGAPVSWVQVSGGMYVDPSPQGGADTRTDKYGIAGAKLVLSNKLGDQEVDARIDTGAQALTYKFFSTARPAPAVFTGGIVDSASGRALSGFAPGSYLTMYGSNLSDSFIEFSSIFPQNFPYPYYLPISLGNVSVSFDVPEAGISVPAPIRFISPGQMNIQIPWELSGQTSAKMKVTIYGIQSAVYDVPLNDYAPAVFENPIGSSYALAQDAATYELITSSNRAKKCDDTNKCWVAVYMNGLGPIDPHPASGALAPSDHLLWARQKPSVTLGGRPVDVNFWGLTPDTIGLYQVNVHIPAAIPSGDQPLVVSVGGVTAKTVKLPVQ
jgi:minor extracellular serine protease Vpr